MATPCQSKPWVCKPRIVSFVAFDADDTIWDIKPYGIASSITGPLKRIDPDTVEAGEKPYGYGVSVKGKPKPKPPKAGQPYVPIRYRSPGWWKEPELWEKEPEQFFMEEMAEEEMPGEEQLELEEIADELYGTLSKKDKEFLMKAGEVTGKQLSILPFEPEKKPEEKPKYSFEPRKVTIKLKPGFRDTLDTLNKKGIKCSIISLNTEGSVKRILDAFGLKDKFVQIDDTWDNKSTVFAKQMDKFKVNPCNAVFIDNMQSHVEGIAHQGALGLVFGHDVKDIAQVLSYIENHGS
jgi:predicted phosphatase